MWFLTVSARWREDFLEIVFEKYSPEPVRCFYEKNIEFATDGRREVWSLHVSREKKTSNSPTMIVTKALDYTRILCVLTYQYVFIRFSAVVLAKWSIDPVGPRVHKSIYVCTRVVYSKNVVKSVVTYIITTTVYCVCGSDFRFRLFGRVIIIK